ncbi:MGMT family protein [Brevibacterium zhoupengii]|uniref:MGMT family protein n=1 Tax=Brevibacterium zhoupengii TaxID=2898795 RepID=UPI001E5E2A41|nr:MGMT family protein [Brevibacterium zhoupengii]
MSNPTETSVAKQQGILDAAAEAVRSVPAGSVATYGDIAAIINAGPRQAGRLVGQIADTAPWWRIVYADGTPSTCHAGTAGDLLRQEGIEFLGQRVNMSVQRITRD